MARLYKILERVGNAYRLQLLDSVKVYPMFSPDKLRKASTDPLPGQKNDLELPIQVNGDDEWEVDKVLASRIVRKVLKYQVSWKGYDPDPTWYPAWNFTGSPQLLKQFHNAYPKKPGPPKYLDEWLQCWKEGTEPEEHKDKNATKA